MAIKSPDESSFIIWVLRNESEIFGFSVTSYWCSRYVLSWLVKQQSCLLQVISALRGDELLPWEGSQNESVRKELGTLRNIVLKMLYRDPNSRPSIKDLYEGIARLDNM